MSTPLRPLPALSPALLSALLSSLLLGACALTRVAPPAPAPVPAAFKQAGDWQPATGQLATPDAWWTLYQDPVLNDLAQRLLAGNLTLQGLAAQVRSARATLDASQSAGLPSLSLGLTPSRTASPRSGSNETARNPANSVALTASASWELDLWDRLGLASEGSAASLQASRNDLASARLSAQATLVQSYFSLRGNDALLVLLRQSADAYQRALTLTQARYDAGVAARSDVLQARTQWQSALAQIEDLTAQRAVTEHAIAVLLGLAPAELTIAPNDTPLAVPAVPAFLPSTLLERRPDIAAAQQRVAAAYAQIGVADAAFFPSLSLSASAGYRQSGLAGLLSAPNLLWSLGGSLTQTLLDSGQRQLASTQARAAADQATANYRQVVLTALQEVEDNLVLSQQLQREAAVQAQAVDAAEQALRIINDQYAAGVVGTLNVISAQNTALTARSNLLAVQTRQLAASNQLLKNLAGRWDSAATEARP